MRMFFRFTICATAVLTCACAVTMQEFDIDLEYRNTEQLEKLATVNRGVAIGVDAFTEHYRAHMYDMRNNYSLSKAEYKVVRYDELYYYRTVYNLIPTEIARAVFAIKGGTVEYTNNCNDVIECNGVGYTNIADYNRSNWNYILFVNIVNTWLNSSEKIAYKTIFKRVVNHYKAKEGWTEKCEELLKLSLEDMRKYRKVLSLDKYLSNMRYIRKTMQNIDVAKQECLTLNTNAYWTKEDWFNRQNDVEWYTIVEKFGRASIRSSFGNYNYELKVSYNKGMMLMYDVFAGNGKTYRDVFCPLNPRLLYEPKCNTGYTNVYAAATMNLRNKWELIWNDKAFTQRLRNGMKRIRRDTENGKDKDKKYLIVYANNILNEINYADGCGFGSHSIATVGGLPDVSNTNDAKSSGHSTEQQMQNVMKARISHNFAMIAEKMSKDYSIKDLKDKITEELDAILG